MKAHLLLLALLAIPAIAGTYTAATCNYADVNAVVNGPTHVAVAGDIIQIPAGTCTWTNGIVVTVGITISGNGTPNNTPGTFGAGTTNTVLIDNYPGGAVISLQGIPFGQTSRISTLDIEPQSATTALVSPLQAAGTCTSSGCPNLRIDNIVFGLTTQWTEAGNGAPADWMIRTDNIVGVIDHTSLPPGSNVALLNGNLSAYLGVGGFGDNSWAQPDSFGGANVMYVENSIVNGGGFSDCDNNPAGGAIGGCRIAVRFNQSSASSSNGFVYVHGLDTDGRPQGGRQIEVYGNTLNCTSGSFGGCQAITVYRSGTGFTFANTAAVSGGGFYNQIASILVFRTVFNNSSFGSCGGSSAWDTNDGTVYYSGTTSTNGQTLTDTSKSWTTNQFIPNGAPFSVYDVTQGWWAEIASNTGNTLTINGSIPEQSNSFNSGDSYQILRATVCADQGGRGQGNYISGGTPTPASALSQALDPIYEWNNTVGTLFHGNVGTDTGRTIANRDWYTDGSNGSPQANTSPTSPFNGTSGVGFGTLANRPTTCTVGVGYFATDQGNWNQSSNGFGQGQLSTCVSTNTWAIHYTPYTYPHPLISGGGSLLPPSFSPPGASYGPAQTVTISLPSGSTGCFTVDGSTPTATTAGTCSHGTTYSTPITVSTSLTVKALATKVGFTNSAVANAVYVINGALAAPTISPATGTYAGPQTVTISGPAGSTVWYNFTGTFTGCTASSCPTATMYSSPVTVATSETIHALATEAGWSNSAVATAAYTINGALPAPTFTPSAGSYGPTQTITINLPAGAAGCYTTDGSTPAAATPGTCSHGTTVSGTVSVSSTLTLKAISTEATFLNSSVSSALYTINGALSTPTFSPNGGSFALPQTVSITCPAGATCWYNFTGTFTSCTPTVCTGATMYSAPVAVSTTSTLFSIATEAGWSNSTVGSAAFTINGTLSAPTFSPPGAVYSSTQTVTVNLPMGSTGCYTSDGTAPTATTPGTCSNGTTVSGTVSVPATVTLKALATEAAFANSSVASATYTIISPSPCTISSPTASQLIQAAAPLQLNSSCSTAPTATKAIYFVDYQRVATGYSNPSLGSTINDFSTAWCGPFCATWWPGLNGDGSHTVFAQFYQFDTLLATTPTVSFTVRLEGMSNQTVNALPTSGTGEFGVLSNGPGAHFMLDGLDGSNSNYFGDPLYHFCGLDGGTGQAGGWKIPALKTSCWPNGQHLIVAGTYPTTGAADPYVVTQTFTSANVSGNNITVTNHSFQNGNAAVCLGACPAPIVAGAQFFWTTSPTWAAGTVAVSIAGGVGTFTCSSACGVTSGTTVNIENIQSTNQVTGQPNCDGQYTAASGSGTSFTVNLPAVCNGASGAKNLEVDINPIWIQYVDGNTVSFSATPGGSTIPLTNTGSGTMTIQSRTRSPYYTVGGFVPGQTMGADYVQYGGPANIYQLVTFSNGAAPMQLMPKFGEMHLVAGASPTALCNAATLIENTDLTFSATACNASGLTWTEVDDGGVSGVCSVDASGNVTPIMAGWCKVNVACTACAVGGVTLPTVTVFVQVHAGSVTFPHYTRSGVLANAFMPGQSFYPISAYQFNPAQAPSWLGPALMRSNVNSLPIGFTYQTNLTNPTATSCPTWPDSTMSTWATFAQTWNLTLEYDMYPVWFQQGSNATSLAAILNNTGYNRRACLATLVSYLIGLGRVWRIYPDDEVSNIIGNYLEPNPLIGQGNFISATTAGGVATFNVANITSLAAFNQATGQGNAIQITGATTNSCLNGWFLLTTVSSSTLTAPAGSCGNGLTINATSDPSASMNLPFPGLATSGTTLLQNAGPLPANLGQTEQTWDSNLTSIVVSGSTGTIHWTGHAVTSGTAIRLYCFACAHTNLNFIGVPVVTDANTLTITWTGTTGGTPPAAGTYNNSTDPSGFYLTVDPNWGANPLGQFYALVNAVPNHPLKAFSMLGTLFFTPSTVYSYQGNPVNTDSSWLYVPQGPPNYTGADISVNQVANYSQSTSGIASRAYQLAPRSMLFYGGYIGGGNMVQYQRSFYFDPSTDRPAQNGLNWRPETTLTQMMSMKTIGVRGLRLYNGYQNTSSGYTQLGLGWNAPGNGGFGTGAGMSPYTAPKTWAAMAHTNALLVMREDTELQPEDNKPYLGPYFQTDAHLSATYGNERTVVCASEMPYGAITFPLNPISGGSTLLYTSDGYSTRVSTVAGNPSSITQEFCPSPGYTWVYVSQPPGYTALDQVTFTPPSPLPFSAVHMLIQVGYYPDGMQDDPVFDATSGVTVPIDHHNINAWYRTLYCDSNFQPLSISDPTLIPSQNLP